MRLMQRGNAQKGTVPVPRPVIPAPIMRQAPTQKSYCRNYLANTYYLMEVSAMANRYEEIIRAEWEKFCSEENKLLPNIMLLGATGCGKSSLINLVFGKEMAVVNDVSRGTTGFETYWGREHGMSVNLIDSRGYEMEDGSGESFSSYYNSIKEKMAESKRKDPLEKIHIIWFCISVAAGRIQVYDTQILKLLRGDSELQSRISIVLTKCDEDDEDGSAVKIFKRIIATDVGNSLPVFEVSTDANLKLDLEKLMVWSANQLDNADLKEAFVASQMMNLDAKREAAIARIGFYAVAAAGIGATPIPVSDAALLTPLQVTMATNIIHIYGMENFASISKALIGDIVISNLGKAFAGGLLKLIPGVGAVIGGAINAGVASLITSAIGFAISEICYDSCKKITNGEYVDMSSMFDAETIQMYVKDYMEKNKK